MREIRWKTASWSLLYQIPWHFKSLVYSVWHLARYRKYLVHSQIDCSGFDIITVVPKIELNLLRLQARSLARFLDAAFDGEIILVINDLDPAGTIRKIRHKILPEYGRWKDNVRIIPFYHIGHGLDPTNGWVFQQALKLAISGRVSKPYYVVLDTKNHAVRDFSVASFISTSGRGFQTHAQLSAYLAAHSEVCARYFGLGATTSSLMPCVPATPFVMHTQSVRELIEHIEAREARSFFAFFCQTRLISEFLLYSFYLQAIRINELNCFHEEGPFLSKTIWPKGAELDDAITEATQNKNVLFFAVHREVLKNQCKTERVQVEAYWRGCGLLEQGETLEQLAS
jgi:hypothetical protein